jgi:hypothetical protein
MYRTVRFASSFENEWKFDAKGDPIAPGARALANAVASELGRQEDSITHVAQWSFYGWAFAAKVRGCWFINVLNPTDKVCYLTVHLRKFWFHALTLRHPWRRLRAYCAILEKSLTGIPQVSEVIWE